MLLHLRTYRGQASQRFDKDCEREWTNQSIGARALSPGTAVDAFTDLGERLSEWQGEDLNLRPSGYEACFGRVPGNRLMN
jgi:hypothetical protein